MPLEIAQHAGFCMGVKRAVAMAEEAALEAKEQGLRCCSLGEVVHNPLVTKRLEDMGVTVVKSVAEAKGALLILRSHGVGPDVIRECEALSIPVKDCTCKHVLALHAVVADYSAAGDPVVLVGDKDHPEVKCTAGWCKGEVYVVSSREDVQALPPFRPERRE